MGKMPEVVGETVLMAQYGKRIVERRFLDPNGQEWDFLLWGGKVTPVIVLPVTRNKQVVAIQTFRRAANEYLIEIPGGNPEPQEDVAACGWRELFEETGFLAGEIVELGPPVWFDPASCFTPFSPLLALGCREASSRQGPKDETEDGESMKVMLIDFAEWIRMIHSGEIRDAKTIVTTFLALPHLQGC